MRPLAVVMFTLVTVTILVSYLYIPKTYAVSLAGFYRQYWHLLTALFFISIFFLSFAFYVEHKLLIARWTQHFIALLFISLFVWMEWLLVEITNIFLAFLA
jgi:hypothetical protein